MKLILQKAEILEAVRALVEQRGFFPKNTQLQMRVIQRPEFCIEVFAGTALDVRGRHSTNLLTPEPARVLKTVMSMVCKEFEVTEEQIRARSKFEPMMTARHAFNYFMHGYGLKTERIGELTGRDRGSVFHSIKTFRDRMDVEKSLKARAGRLQEQLNHALRVPETLRNGANGEHV